MARTTIRTEDITASAVTSAKIAAGAVDTSGLEDDIALIGFKVAANGSLAKYDLVDQTVDDFQDASGIDASASTSESRNASNYYYGLTLIQRKIMNALLLLEAVAVDQVAPGLVLVVAVVVQVVFVPQQDLL